MKYLLRLSRVNRLYVNVGNNFVLLTIIKHYRE